VILDLLRTGLLSKMATSYDDCHTGNDMGALTVMNDDILTESSSRNDTRYQRDVSWIQDLSGRRTNRSQQFWHFRYQVQKIQYPFHEQAQKDVSARLTILNRFVRFDCRAIHKIKVRQVIIELLERTSALKHDRYRLRKRSQRLMKRLSGTIYAYRRWPVRVR
jgi:hypothetical protein